MTCAEMRAWIDTDQLLTVNACPDTRAEADEVHVLTMPPA
jgi:hypothetical protein